MARGVKTGGRKKGSANKITRDLRAMIVGALDKAGGRAYLVRQSKANPAAFMSLVSRCVPKEVNMQVDGALQLDQLIEKAHGGSSKTPGE